MLRISRGAAYELARQWRESGGRHGLPVVTLGRSLRVPATHCADCSTSSSPAPAGSSARRAWPRPQGRSSSAARLGPSAVRSGSPPGRRWRSCSSTPRPHGRGCRWRRVSARSPRRAAGGQQGHRRRCAAPPDSGGCGAPPSPPRPGAGRVRPVGLPARCRPARERQASSSERSHPRRPCRARHRRVAPKGPRARCSNRGRRRADDRDHVRTANPARPDRASPRTGSPSRPEPASPDRASRRSPRNRERRERRGPATRKQRRRHWHPAVPGVRAAVAAARRLAGGGRC